jgi:di/tricarboxylate transporter
MSFSFFYTSALLVLMTVVLIREWIDVELKTQIDWRVLIVIACAFGISSAVTKSGIADVLSRVILACNTHWGIMGTLAGLYCITNIYTTFISNNAAAAMLFPIALAKAGHL